MILQIRATSGGGKTTLMRYLLDLAYSKPKRVVKTARGSKTLINRGYWLGYPFFVIGPYDTEGTGGCDRLSSIDEAIQLVEACASITHSPDGNHKGIVCFEGLLLAHSWGAMGEFLHEKYGPRYMNAFIDTSVEQCFENVMKRRATAGASLDDPDRIAKIRKNVVDDHYRVELAHKRVIARGGRLIDVPYENSGPFVRDYLCNWVEGQRILYGA